MSANIGHHAGRLWGLSIHTDDSGSDLEYSSGRAESLKVRGAHRDGYSEEKCRYVLVKHCGDFPRNFNYSDGSHLVYEILRFYLGDENLDLSIGVLHEFIEMETEYTWEEGSAFRRWRHAHSLRAKDLGNAHVPRLGNIVVAPVIPTSRLREWRSHSCSTSNIFDSTADITGKAPKSPGFGLRTEWQINHSTFVSVPGRNTTVLQCPSAQELNALYFKGECGQKGRLVKERTITPGVRAPRLPTEISITAFDDINAGCPNSVKGARCSSHEFMKLIRMMVSHGLRSILNMWHRFASTKTKDNDAMSRVRCGCDCNAHRSFSATAYENLLQVKRLPNPESQEGRAYYGTINNVPLPECCDLLNGSFMRKNVIIPRDVHLPESFRLNRLHNADDLAVHRSAQSLWQAADFNYEFCFNGPFTAELFKDSGVDYRWSHDSLSTAMDFSRLGDGSDSPTWPHWPLPGDSHGTRDDLLVLPGMSVDSGAGASDDFSCKPPGKFENISEPFIVGEVDGSVYESVKASIPGNDPARTNRLNNLAKTPTTAYAAAAGILTSDVLVSKMPLCDSGDLDCTTDHLMVKHDSCGQKKRSRGLQRLSCCAEAVMTSLSQAIVADRFSKINNRTALYCKQDNNKTKVHQPRQMTSIPPTSAIHETLLNVNNWPFTNHNTMEMGRELSPLPLPTPVIALDIERRSARSFDASNQKPEMLLPLAYDPIRDQQKYPPRTSSMPESETTSATDAVKLSSESTAAQPAKIPLGEMKEYVATHNPQLQASQNTTTKFCSQHRGPGAPSGIMGNFVLLESPQASSKNKIRPNVGFKPEPSSSAGQYYCEISKSNPFEFESETPMLSNSRSTGTSNLITSRSSRDTILFGLSPKNRTHLKNSLSEGNVLDGSEERGTTRFDYSKYTLSKSDSSPNFSPHKPNQRPFSPEREDWDEYENPSYHAGNEDAQGLFRSSARARGLSRSPNKQIDEVPEKEEVDSHNGIRGRSETIADSSPPTERRHRTRSPMKKMFGEKGWLGTTTDLNEHKAKKLGMMAAIKTRIGELAKADMSPIKRTFMPPDKEVEVPRFPISLHPPQQGKLYMDLELLICETANRFLLDQYSAERLSAESVRKVNEFWRSKNRPGVVEFRYDQATQRDLVVANQHNFLFHGPAVGNSQRINAVLWTWKENAREMAVRTFCYADSVIAKQLNDTYNLLELLGADHMSLFTLQGINLTYHKQVYDYMESQRSKAVRLIGNVRAWNLPVPPKLERSPTSASKKSLRPLRSTDNSITFER
ncbi:MAG: hypothetical protein M1818_001845 [Claussenomyces sp. TS43310]|nr:MAG: hypothetical protein M1818_001845 [Claussenomyces sp. TS43310]